MGIEFKHNGRIWRADTVEEAVALRQKLEADDDAALEAGEYVSLDERKWTHDLAMDLLKNAGVLQKKFLRAIYDQGGITSAKVIEKLKLDSEIALAGVLSGLSKQLKKLGMKPRDLYMVGVSWNAKTKTRSFCLTNDFRSAAAELGWPDNWE